MKNKNLIVTICVDKPNSRLMLNLGKILISSLTRTFAQADIVVFHNSLSPLFTIKREGVREIVMESFPEGLDDVLYLKFLIRNYIPKDYYEKILFLDADCVVIRNIDHLLASDDWDILIQRERGRSVASEAFNGYLTKSEMENLKIDGINSGTFAVKANVYHHVMKEWENITERNAINHTRWLEQSAWNRLIIDTKLRVKNFESHEIQFPLHIDKNWSSNEKSAILHAVGESPEKKLKYLFGVYMQNFFYDEDLSLLKITDI